MRLFVAISLPSHVREVLAAAQRALAERLVGSDIRWQDLERSHLTLVFLGDVAERDLPACRLAVTTTAERARPFTLRTDGLGAFPAPRRPSVLWLGVAGETGRLERVQAALADRLGGFGDSSPQGPFRPHLTLARVRRLSAAGRRELPELLGPDAEEQEAGRSTARPQSWPSRSWQAESLQLVRSTLKAGGAGHEVLLSAPLTGALGQE
jgi:2'-5' RNA ligase